VTDLEHQRVAEWLGDAFAILCVRVGGASEAESNLRLGFEAILRLLRIPPLVTARAVPAPYRRVTATRADLRHILKALDSCLAIFQRYERVLTPTQRDLQQLVQQTRRFAEAELEMRTGQPDVLMAV
jgi:hypothetical protein